MMRIVIAGLLAAGALFFADRASAADAGCYVYPPGTTFVPNTRQILPCIPTGGAVTDIDSVGGVDVPVAGQDNDTNARPGVPTYSRGMLWDGVAWDRQPGSAELGTEVNVPDGQDVALGALADAACATDVGACSLIALTKRSLQTLTLINASLTDLLVAYGPTGSPVPAQAVYVGVNVGGNLTGMAPGTAGTASTQVTTVQGIAAMTPILANPGTAANWAIGATAASAPANAVQQGVLVGANLVGESRGSAGTASSQVVTVQGIASMTPVAVSGTVSSTQGTSPWIVAGGGTAGAPGAAVLTVQGVASGTPVVNNQTQINGVALLAGNGPTGTGSPRVTIANDNTPFPIKIDQTTPGTTNAVSFSAAATGGCTPGKLLSAASTNSTQIKSTAGTLCTLGAINTTTTIYYLKVYNVSAAPTCNSSTVVATWPVPPASAAGSAGGVMVNLGTYGIALTTGIGICLTAGLADTDNAAAVTGIAINYSYK